MRKLSFLLMALFFLQCQAQTDQKFNLGFEKRINTQGLSDGWFKWGEYPLTVDTTSHSGKYAGKITSSDNGSFGCLAYRIPASYSGETIKLEGYMKTKNVEGGHAGLLLRVDGDAVSLVFDNMKNQGITGTNDWKKYSITLQYPEEGMQIYVAGILVGKGEVWFDDLVLTIDDKDVQTLKEVKKAMYNAEKDKEFDAGSKVVFPELTSDITANLELLGHVWGFLKYYHPAIAKGDYNWDYELFRILPTYLSVENNAQRDVQLIKWIDGLGETKQGRKGKPVDEEAKLKPDMKWFKDIENESLKAKLQEVFEYRSRGNQYYIKMARGVGNPVFTHENAYKTVGYPDAGYRLLCLYRYWNMINYFFPYKHLIQKDWNSTLNAYIPKFINATNELEYEFTTTQLIGEINDSHATLMSGNNKIEEWKGRYFAPVHCRFIGQQLVVDDYFNPELKEEAELEIGDVITKVNGRAVNDIVANISKYYPASNQPTRLRDISADMLRSQEQEIDITYLRDGKEKNKKLKLYHRNRLNIYRWYKKDNEKCYRLLDNNIGYITLKSIKKEDIKTMMDQFKNTKGIIIDIRNYPSTFVPFLLGTYFVDSPTPFVKFTKGNIECPGEFTFGSKLVIAKSSHPYTGKLVVLVNEISQSQAEYTAMAFRAGANSTIIGSTTAGADGNVSSISLPGGMRTMISGIGVYYPNGEETQRVGIVPDIEVHPTIAGIKDGRDELVEKAVEVILAQ
ncbi:peptidase S41 [Puteibacter caeruleilacunae]|nr:peptidase S41 [Puteibacter caeruleilacunae]